MSEQFKIYIAVIIGNVIKVLAFVGLAIFFNKWWIALFGLFGETSLKWKELNKETQEEKSDGA